MSKVRQGCLKKTKIEHIHLKGRKLLSAEINIIHRLQRMREIKLMLNHLMSKHNREIVKRKAQYIILDSDENEVPTTEIDDEPFHVEDNTELDE